MGCIGSGAKRFGSRKGRLHNPVVGNRPSSAFMHYSTTGCSISLLNITGKGMIQRIENEHQRRREKGKKQNGSVTVSRRGRKDTKGLPPPLNCFFSDPYYPLTFVCRRLCLLSPIQFTHRKLHSLLASPFSKKNV